MEAIATFIGAFLGSFAGAALSNYLLKPKPQEIKLEPGTGTMKDHVYVDVVKKKTVFRDKEIEKEEQGRA